MSDFNPNPSVPPAPGATVPQPAPFGPPGAPPPPPPVGYVPPGYAPLGNVSMGKPPRPAVPVGSVLLIVGGLMLIAGSFLSWFSGFGESYNGFSNADGGSKDGPVFLVLGLLVLGFGIAQLLARKVLVLGILAIIVAVMAALAAVADISDVARNLDEARKILEDFGTDFGFEDDFSWGPGLWVILVGSVVALAGGIATVAKRRK